MLCLWPTWKTLICHDIVISFEKSNNKVLTMLVTLKQSTVISYSILIYDFIILLLKH